MLELLFLEEQGKAKELYNLMFDVFGETVTPLVNRALMAVCVDRKRVDRGQGVQQDNNSEHLLLGIEYTI